MLKQKNNDKHLEEEPPGCDWLKRGYNNVTKELSAQIFSSELNSKINQYGAPYCITNIAEYNTKEELSKALSAEWGGSCTGNLFSQNSEVSNTSKTASDEKFKTVKTEIILRHLQRDTDDDFFSDRFAKALAALPAQYDKSYTEFVNTFGTHFIKEIKIGGAYIEVTSSHKGETTSTKKYRSSVEAGNGQDFSIKNGAGAESQHERKSADSLSEIIRHGGDCSGTLEDWKKSVKKNPAIFPKSFGYLYDLPGIKDKRDALKQAITNKLLQDRLTWWTSLEKEKSDTVGVNKDGDPFDDYDLACSEVNIEGVTYTNNNFYKTLGGIKVHYSNNTTSKWHGKLLWEIEKYKPIASPITKLHCHYDANGIVGLTFILENGSQVEIGRKGEKISIFSKEGYRIRGFHGTTGNFFYNITSIGVIYAPQFSAEEIAKLAEVFRNFDQDQSGSINKEELNALFQHTRQCANIEALMNKYDVDRDGALNWDEFLNVVAEVYQKRGNNGPNVWRSLPFI